MSCDEVRKHLIKEAQLSTEESKYVRTRKLKGATWAVGMTTAYRRVPTVEATLESLREAGWHDCTLYAEPDANVLPKHVSCSRAEAKLGAWLNFARMVKEMRQVDATHFLFVQDDVEFLPDTRQWLEDNWPTSEGVISIYRCSRYSIRDTPGPFDYLSYARPFLGALAIVMPRAIVQSLATNVEVMADPNTKQVDIKLGKWIHALRIPLSIAKASRCQHTGDVSAIYNETTKNEGVRRSSTYAPQ